MSDNITGQIYIITNIETNKMYIGQTLSHRLNRGKYKPFGYEGRFKDHISEALCNTKKKQCTYLNNSIRQYGKNNFNIHLLHTCPIDELDKWEIQYIKQYNTLYPNGYNLTSGGKGAKPVKHTLNIEQSNLPKKRGGCKERSDETRTKISDALRKVTETVEFRTNRMETTQLQHSLQKLHKFRNSVIDTTKLDQYIRIKHTHGQPFIIVRVGTLTTSFVGKYESKDALIDRAKQFLLDVSNIATLPNCSGNP